MGFIRAPEIGDWFIDRLYNGSGVEDTIGSGEIDPRVVKAYDAEKMPGFIDSVLGEAWQSGQ